MQKLLQTVFRLRTLQCRPVNSITPTTCKLLALYERRTDSILTDISKHSPGRKSEFRNDFIANLAMIRSMQSASLSYSQFNETEYYWRSVYYIDSILHMVFGQWPDKDY